MTQDAFGDLVVAIPGILGSRLVRKDGGRLVTVWDFSLRHLPALLRSMATGGLVLDGNGIDPDQGVRRELGKHEASPPAQGPRTQRARCARGPGTLDISLPWR